MRHRIKLNSKGQILIPGLAAYLGLILLFLGLVVTCIHSLTKMRLDTAAQAAALSAARAEAELLNHCAGHNLTANLFLGRYKGKGAIQAAVLQEFQAWLEIEQLKQKLNWAKYLFSGFKGFPSSVGSTVAKLNGARATLPKPMDIQLVLKDLEVFIFDGLIPDPVPVLYENVYYARTWGDPSERRAQPPHQTTWLVSKGSSYSMASAHVYLDVKPDDFLQNGGFPHEDAEGLDAIGFQSFYPTFDAKLIKTLQ